LPLFYSPFSQLINAGIRFKDVIAKFEQLAINMNGSILWSTKIISLADNVKKYNRKNFDG
jgi:hypothetical protein